MQAWCEPVGVRRMYASLSVQEVEKHDFASPESSSVNVSALPPPHSSPTSSDGALSANRRRICIRHAYDPIPSWHSPAGGPRGVPLPTVGSHEAISTPFRLEAHGSAVFIPIIVKRLGSRGRLLNLLTGCQVRLLTAGSDLVLTTTPLMIPS